MFVLLLALGLAFLLCLWTAFSFSFVQELSEPASVKGSRRILRIGIYNDKPFPLTMMRVQVETVSPREKLLLSFNLPSRDSVHFSIPIHCPYRGIYRVGMTRLEMNGIFGLVHLSLDMRSLPYYRQREIKIYPRMIELPFLPTPRRDDKLAGGGRLRIAEEGEAFSHTRDYRPGDPAKRIHWKQAARRGELAVKQYEIPAETGVALALDTAPCGLEGENALRMADLACECAAAIALYSLGRGFAVRLLDADGARRPLEGETRDAMGRINEWLAVLPFGERGDLSAALRAHAAKAGEKTVYVLTHRPGEALRDAMADLQLRGSSVVCLLLAPELSGSGGTVDLPGVRCRTLPYGEDIAGQLGGLL